MKGYLILITLFILVGCSNIHKKEIENQKKTIREYSSLEIQEKKDLKKIKIYRLVTPTKVINNEIPNFFALPFDLIKACFALVTFYPVEFSKPLYTDSKVYKVKNMPELNNYVNKKWPDYKVIYVDFDKYYFCIVHNTDYNYLKRNYSINSIKHWIKNEKIPIIRVNFHSQIRR